MTIGDRIRKTRENLKISQTELANLSNTTKQNIYKYENGIITNIPSDKIETIAKILRVSPAYLMGWSEMNEKSNIAEVLPKSEIRMIPLFETVSAGFGAYASDEIIDYVPLFIENDYEAEKTLCIKVKGDSMFPKIENGDIVQVLKQDMVDSGQIAVVLIDGEEGLVKKVIIEKDYIELISLNPEYQPKKFEKEEMNRVSIVGLVKKIIKECW